MDTTNSNTFLPPGGGELIEIAGNRIRILVARRGQLVCDYTAPAGAAGPPLHIHPGFDETYLVLEGALQITLDGRHEQLSPGAVSHVSGATPHTFGNPADQPVRFLSICTPGGFEHYFRALATGDRRMLREISAELGYETVEAA